MIMRMNMIMINTFIILIIIIIIIIILVVSMFDLQASDAMPILLMIFALAAIVTSLWPPRWEHIMGTHHGIVMSWHRGNNYQ